MFVCGMPLQDLRSLRLEIILTQMRGRRDVVLFAGTVSELLRISIPNCKDVAILVKLPSKELIAIYEYNGQGQIKDNEFVDDRYVKGERLFPSYAEIEARIIISTSGNVGIGTTNPSVMLDVKIDQLAVSGLKIDS